MKKIILKCIWNNVNTDKRKKKLVGFIDTELEDSSDDDDGSTNI